ncbi:MAG: ASCH domain-containing protein [Candidatus Iainarchaeum sp.]|jgi:predicted transcriptional regulator
MMIKMTKIKVLSIKQPWAELIIKGQKTIELRTTQRNYRGELYIHSSKTPDNEAMKQFRYAQLLNGAIIGKVEFIDIKEYSNNNEFNKDKDKHLSNGELVKFGWIFKNPQRIKPVLTNGTLGIWEFEL